MQVTRIAADVLIHLLGMKQKLDLQQLQPLQPL